MSFITLGLRLVNFKGSSINVLDKRLFLRELYLFTEFHRHSSRSRSFDASQDKMTAVRVGNSNLLLLSLFWPKKKMGYSKERDLSGQVSRRASCKALRWDKVITIRRVCIVQYRILVYTHSVILVIQAI